MACISKLANAIAYDCDTGAAGLVSAIIINKADIESFVLSSPSATRVVSIAMAAAGKAYRIDAVKRSVTASTALKVNDGAPNAYKHTVALTITGIAGLSALSQAFSNGNFVVITKGPSGPCYVYGLYYGLSATAYDRSSHDNGGWVAVTLETPETVIGEDNLYMDAVDYDALYAAAVG